MTDLEQLIAMGNQLASTLDRMANNERQYGADLCHLMEQISYEFHKSTCELREISHYCIGGVA